MITSYHTVKKNFFRMIISLWKLLFWEQVENYPFVKSGIMSALIIHCEITVLEMQQYSKWLPHCNPNI